MELLSDIGELVEAQQGAEGAALENKLEALTLAPLSEEKLQEASVLATVKCLQIAKIALEKARLSPQENSSLQGILNELVFPSIENELAVVQEYGIECLGLFCSLDKVTFGS